MSLIKVFSKSHALASGNSNQKSPTPSLRASKASVAIHNGKDNLNSMDCHEKSNDFSRNDDKNSQNSTKKDKKCVI